MTNKEKYRRTFEALHASKEELGKVYSMEKSKKKIRPVRILLAAACLTALLAVSALAANAVSDGALFRSLSIWIDGREIELTQAGENSYRFETKDGYGTLTVLDEREIGEDESVLETTIELEVPDGEAQHIAIMYDGEPERDKENDIYIATEPAG